MALVNGYCAVAELRDHLKDDGARLDAEILERAISAASRSVDRYTGRRFWQDSDIAERTYIVADQTVARVDDISTRTGVIVATGSDGSTFPTTLTVGSDFILEPRNADKFASSDFDAFAFWAIRLVNGGRFYCYNDRPTLSVSARHGWSAVPHEVKLATILKAAQLFKRKDAPFGVAGFGEFGVVRIGRNDPDVVDMLTPYRRLDGFA